MGFPNGSPQNREILSEDVDSSTGNFPRARNNAIAPGFSILQPESGCSVLNEHTDLRKGPRVQQRFDTLPRCLLILGVLTLNTSFAPTETGFSSSLGQLLL
jgi:hypothetical protein